VINLRHSDISNPGKFAQERVLNLTFERNEEGEQPAKDFSKELFASCLLHVIRKDCSGARTMQSYGVALTR
jgi:hypothetical protein